MFNVYAISSQSRKYVYIGLTNDLERRIEEHQSGNNKTTKPYRPFKLIYSEKFGDRIEARKREKFLKSSLGRKWIKESFL